MFSNLLEEINNETVRLVLVSSFAFGIIYMFVFDFILDPLDSWRFIKRKIKSFSLYRILRRWFS